MTVRRVIPLLPAGLLGVAAAVLVSCGSSSVGLIPSENAGPLVADFQAVEQAALKGGGDCSATEAALRKTESDFRALPRSVDAGLRAKLHQGIAHLHGQALELCAQPLTQTTTTGESTTTTGTTPPPSTTKSSTAPTNTTPPTSTSPTTPSSTTPPSSAEGGTAPEAGVEGKSEEGGAGGGQGGAGGSESEEEASHGGAGVPGGGGGQ